MKISTSAPSNIALIKYMGKIEVRPLGEERDAHAARPVDLGLGNRPTNASISYTLENLRTFVDIELSLQDKWEPLVRPDAFPLSLKPAGQEKFLKHLKFLKSKWNIQEKFLLKSSNNFPSDCGLASSASSFAALTLACAEMFQKINPQPWGEDFKELSRLSRQGSGSSCRSLFSPWALWKDEGAEPIDLPAGLHHAVIVLEKGVKEVSSSEAHKRVITSPRFQGRVPRAEKKLEELISAIRKEQWKWAYEIIWDEFWDMHELFHTSQPPFGYMTSECKDILKFMEKNWKSQNHGPWITLDAGPNIHLLFQNEDLNFAKKYLEDFKKYTVMTSWGKN